VLGERGNCGEPEYGTLYGERGCRHCTSRGRAHPRNKSVSGSASEHLSSYDANPGADAFLYSESGCSDCRPSFAGSLDVICSDGIYFEFIDRIGDIWRTLSDVRARGTMYDA